MNRVKTGHADQCRGDQVAATACADCLQHGECAAADEVHSAASLGSRRKLSALGAEPGVDSFGSSDPPGFEHRVDRPERMQGRCWLLDSDYTITSC